MGYVFRNSYLNRDPNVVPVYEDQSVLTSEQREMFWNKLFGSRTPKHLWREFHNLPADIRDAARDVLESMAGDRLKRKNEMPTLYVAYQGQLNFQTRLRSALAWRMYLYAQAMLEKKKRDLASNTKLGITLFPYLAALELFFLVHKYWQYIEPRRDPRPDEYQDHSGIVRKKSR